MESDTPRTDANVINVDYETREPDGEPSQVIEEVVLVDFARELERELAAAIKQRDEARRDAERYRWLKSDRCYWVEIQSQPSGDWVFCGRGSRVMDAAIDAAIATQKEGGGA
jgi:hypothetical protein